MSKRPHIVWPAVIVSLLLLSGVTTFAVLFASRSDGGAQVVDNYYERSVAWDSVAARARASDSLGWDVTVSFFDMEDKHYGRVVITSLDGRAVDGLTGAVTVTRPQSAVIFGTHGFTADDAMVGAYNFEFPYTKRGLWDLDVVASRGNEQFAKRVRIEI